MRRCHIDQSLTPSITLTEEQIHYLVRVLRLKTTDQWIAFNGKGEERTYQLAEDMLHAHAMSALQIGRLAHPIALCYALPKGDKLERVVRQVTELGVCQVHLWQADHCVQQWKVERSQKKMQRLNKIIQEAARQSHRADLLHLYEPQKLDVLLSSFASIPYKIFLHTQAQHSMQDLVQWMSKVSTHTSSDIEASTHSNIQAIILVGPEGGISTQENQKLKQEGWFDLYLDVPILRTETAAVIACSILLQQLAYF